MNSHRKNELVRLLRLKPHPEGGFYRESYRSAEFILLPEDESHPAGKRNFSTAIYYLLTANTFSAFHRIRQDEIWHFYDGGPLDLHVLTRDGKYRHFVLGNNLIQGQRPQVVVNGGDWFAASVAGENREGYTLVGCTVAPGFDFADFELARRETLLRAYPAHRQVIIDHTRP